MSGLSQPNRAHMIVMSVITSIMKHETCCATFENVLVLPVDLLKN